MRPYLLGTARGSGGTPRRHKGKGRRGASSPSLEALESRYAPTTETFAPGAYIIDMGQPTQTIGNALKPYGLVYDLVANYKVPVNWAINPAKTTYRLNSGDPIPVDFTATITTGTKSYGGGSFIIDQTLLTPAVIADINTWKAQGVVVDQLAAPLTTEIYGQITSFPHAVLDLQNGKIAVPYYANAGIPASSYQLGTTLDLVQCDDVYILPHADPQNWTDAEKLALYDFVSAGGGLWAGCHSVSALEALTTVTVGGVTQPLDFLSNGLAPWGSHSGGTPPYSYNPVAANDPEMQIMNRLDAATQNGSEQIYVPTTLDWRSTTTVAVYDPDQPNNPVGGTSPWNDAAVIAYGNAFGDPTKGLVMYEAGHSLAGTGSANIAAQRAFFNFLLTEGINKAPQANVAVPPIVAGQASTITATITGGSGNYTYQWVSSNGGIFSNPTGTWHVGDPPITTQYLMTGAQDTIKLLITDVPCGRQSVWYESLVDTPPTIDLDANNSSGATGADYVGYFQGGGAIVAAADTDTLITDNGTAINSAAIKLTTRPDGSAETLLIDQALAASYGINVTSDGAGGFVLTGTATLAQYQAVIASLQYTDALPFPTSTDRVITVTVNDGISNSNTATSRLSYLGGSVTTVNKELYLSDPGQGMDRVDPVATGDTTTSSVSVVPVVSNNSTGMAAWTNSARKNLEYRPWNLTAYGTQGTTAADGGSYVTMASAASAKRNEAIVVGVTSDRHVSGSIWNGSTWVPIQISIGGTTRQNLGAPSAANYWGAAAAYETNSGRAMLVWNTGSTLNYSIWNGTSWTAAASIPAYTGVEPRQIRLAANPLSGSNEMVLVVTSKSEVDRALVWNGTSWGNAIQLDNNTGHNFTDMSVVYEQQSGRAMVTYASGTAGAVGYNLWNGSTWSTAATVSAPAGSNNYAQWTVLAADPNSNRIVLGVESNGKDAWMNVWDGTTWGASQLGITDGVSNNNNLGIAVAFESRSGEALAVYQNDLAATELQYMTWASGSGWSASTNFGAFGNQSSRAITLRSNPYSDQIMLMVNDGAKSLRSALWSGIDVDTTSPPDGIIDVFGTFAAPILLETNTNTTAGQPFTFFWDRYIPGTVTTTTTFTQTSAMTSPFVLPSGGAVKVTTYVQLTSGTLPAAPKLAMRLGQSGSTLLTLATSPTVTSLGGGYYKLEWTGSMPNTVTVPAGGQISLTLIDYDSTYNFNVLYDSTTYPSQVQLATATAITVSSLGVYGLAYPGGSSITTTAAGQPAYVRFTVSDPFGASDVTGADLVIKNSLGGTVLSTSLTDAYVVATTAGTKTYEYLWTPPTGDTFTITVTAHEGTEGVTGTGQTTITTTANPDLVVTKSDGGATVNAGGSVAYTINYSNAGLANATGVILTEFLPTGSSFDAAGSTLGWAAVGSGEYRFAVGNLAAGGSGSVVFAVTVPSPVGATLEQLDNAVQIADDGTHGADSNPANNTAVDATPVIAAPDLVITKSDGGTSTLPGGIVLYQISYSNVGTQDANGVVIQETLPANTTFNSTYSGTAWDLDGGVYTLDVGALPVGVSGTVTLAVTVDSPLPDGVAQISNTATIADGGAGGPDLNPANNTATDTTPIANNPQADLQITKTDTSGATYTPGSPVTYTITVTNAGPNAVTGAAFTDPVPASLSGVIYTTAVSAGATVSSASGSGNSITGLLDLPMGGTVIYTVTGTLDPDATGTLSNVAMVLPPAGILDPNTGNNTAVDAKPIVPVSDLSLTKAFTYTDLDGSGTLTPGDRIVFTLTVTNSGPNAANNVSVHDLLPDGYYYVSDDAALNGGSYSQGSGVWTVGTVGVTAPNNTAVLHLTAIVGPGGTYTNVAEVWSSDSRDPDSTPHNYVSAEDDYASVTPVVQPKSDLSLSKTMALTSDLDGNGILSIDDRVTFTLTVSNAGPNAATGVHVADLLPAGYSFVSATASPGNYSFLFGDWNVGTVNVLSTATLNVVATITSNHPASAYTNYAQVSASNSFDPNSTPGNNSTTEDDNASVTPQIADLSVTKTVAFAPGGDLDANGTPSFGDQFVFTLTVSNAGPDYATGVRLVDQLPTGYSYDDDDGAGAYDTVSGLWLVGAVAPGTTRTLHVTATINASGGYANTAQVTASQTFDPDSTPNNNVASEDDQATVTLVPGAAAQPPVAVNDSKLHNPPGAVTLNVTANDTDPNLDLAVGTVDLNPSVAGQQTSLSMPGQGTWTVDSLGNVTFRPLAGFTQDPAPIAYTVQDAGGRTSNQATISIDYVPVATNDSSSGNATGTAVTVNVLANDTTGDVGVPSTVQVVGTPAPGAALVVAGEGTWSVNTTTGAITFTPQPGYTGDPTPVQYTVQDNEGNTSNPATVTVDYNQYPPVAVNDSSPANLPGAVTLNVTANDSDPNNDVDPSTIDLDPAAPGRQTMLIVAGEGYWTVDGAGNVTFYPEVGFTLDPTPIPYTARDATGLVSNQATITVDYVPVATSDSSSGNPTGTPVTVNVLANDTTGDAAVPATVQIVGTASAGDPLVVPGQGTWSVNTTTGAITFSPNAGYIGDPTPLQYTVQDADGNTSNAATVVVDYLWSDLSITKSDGVTAVVAGDGTVYTYTITVTNSGPSDAQNVAVSDSWPAGFSLGTVTDAYGTVTPVPGGSFTLAGSPGSGAPYSVAVGDFNGDGKQDLALANYWNRAVGILLGDGGGGFTPAGSPGSGGSGPRSVAVGGFNGDGKQDLAVANRNSDTVGILLGDGAGGFTLAGSPGSGGSGLFSVAVGDFNGDGKQDLAVANYDSNTVGILLGDGGGGFALAGSPGSGGSGLFSVAVGDFNGDGKQDLAVANGYSGTVGVLLGDGGGGFTPAGSPGSGGSLPYSVAVGDFNGDGKQDLAVANGSSNTVGILLGDGAGGFALAGSPGSGGSGPFSVAVGDFNGDGKQDLALANLYSNTVGILLGQGAGGFTAGLGTLAAGHSATITVTYTVPASILPGPQTNTATVSSDTPDPNSGNNSVSDTDDVTFPPVAVNDGSPANLPGVVTLNVVANDSDANGDLDPSTVDLDPATPGQQTALVVGGQGTWAVDASGNVTFTPEAGFTHDPTPIPYTVRDATGLVSNQATITIDYVPVAANDSSSGNTTGTPVTVDVLANDTTGDAAVPATVQIVGTANPGDPLVVPGQGTWGVNPTTGAITFTPAPGYTGDPTPIQYTVRDAQGNTSAPATVAVDYKQYPPVAADDGALANLPGVVTLNVVANDSDANGDLDPSTVDLNPGTPGQQTMLILAGQGFWQVDGSGNVTFYPEVGFTDEPTPIAYAVQDRTGLVSNPATITIDYLPAITVVKSASPTSVPETGGSVTYTYLVTNTSPAAPHDPLHGISLTDSDGTPGHQPMYASGDTNANGTLDFGETWTYTLTVTLPTGTAGTSHGNTVTAVGADDEGDTASATATASVSYTDVAPSIAVAKSVADIAEGNAATYTFKITNTSSAATDPVTVTSVVDDKLGDLTSAAVAANGGSPIVLQPGASFSFSYTTTAVLNAGTVVNTVTVTGHDDENTAASATDTATLTVSDVAPSIAVAKSVADIAEGNAATYTFKITNTSSAATDPVTVTSVVDDKLGDLTSAAVAANGGSPIVLQPGASFSFSYTTTAVLNAGTVVNTVTVTGHDDENTSATAQDSATLTVPPNPAIRIVKYVNSVDANTAPGLAVPAGTLLTYIYFVTNPGNVSLDSIIVTDDQGLTPVYQGGDTNGNKLLDPGETWTYTATATAQEGQHTNIGTATGKDTILGTTVTASDPANYTGAGGQVNPVALSSLSGYVYVDSNNNGIRERREKGIAKVTIILIGVTDQGAPVQLITRTNKLGFYQFAPLPAGHYIIQEVQPRMYRSGKDTVGTQGGYLIAKDRFFIALGAGVFGRENNFGELVGKQMFIASNQAPMTPVRRTAQPPARQAGSVRKTPRVEILYEPQPGTTGLF